MVVKRKPFPKLLLRIPRCPRRVTHGFFEGRPLACTVCEERERLWIGAVDVVDERAARARCPAGTDRIVPVAVFAPPP